MKTAVELLKAYAKPLCTVAPESTVFEALNILAKHELGALPVIDAQGKLVGIVSERDYTRKVALQGRNSRETSVVEIMTREVMVVSPTTRAFDCMALMSTHNIRHLPVMEGGKLVGVLAIRHLLDEIIAEQKYTIEQLESYIHS